MSYLVIVNLLLGVALGYSLHRSRFCFAGAFRDFILFKDTGLLKAILISLIISSLLFSLVQFSSYQEGAMLLGNFYSIGLYTLVGGLLFGLGMVIAGGCVCSIFLRLGEGFKLFVFVLLGLGMGALAGAGHYPWWAERFTWLEPIFLGDLLGWPLALALQVAILTGLFLYLKRVDNRL